MSSLHPEKPPPLWRLVLEKVRQDQISMRVSALSFHLLFSLLPTLVIILTVLSGATFEKSREDLMDRIVDGLVPTTLGDTGSPPIGPLPEGVDPATYWDGEEALNGERDDIIRQIKGDLRHVIDALSGNLKKIGIVSFLLLLYVVIKLFNITEQTFNAIWKVRVSRSMFNRMAITTTMVVWGPALLSFSFALVAKLPKWNFLNAYLIPMLFTTLSFTAFYMIMPYAKVQFKHALLGGCSAAIAWELSKIGFMYYVKFAVGQSALYGSLSMVPIIFLWVQLTWMVVLGGAELAYVVQHRKVMVSDWIRRQRDNLSRTEAWDAVSREASLLPHLAMAAAFEIATRFRSGKDAGGIPLLDLATSLNVETGSLDRALQRLTDAQILVKVATDANAAKVDEARFLPAKDLSAIPLSELIRACHGTPPSKDGESWARAQKLYQEFSREGERNLEGQSLSLNAQELPQSKSESAPALHGVEVVTPVPEEAPSVAPSDPKLKETSSEEAETVAVPKPDSVPSEKQDQSE